MLDFATGRPTKVVPAHLADSLDAAILRHADPEQNEVAVLLTPPTSESENINRPKDKVSVRGQQSNTHTKMHTSKAVAYHDGNPKLHLAPHLSRCILTKDTHHLGSHKPSLRNHTGRMGRMQPMTSHALCPAEPKPHTQVIGTQAETEGDRRLAHISTTLLLTSASPKESKGCKSPWMIAYLPFLKDLLLDHPDPCAIQLGYRPTKSARELRWPEGGFVASGCPFRSQ